MKKSVVVAICTACRRRRNGNMLVGEGPLLRKNVRTTSTSTNRPTTCPRSKPTSTATYPFRQRAEGAVPGAANAGRRVPTEQVGVVRHAWQRVAMVRRPREDSVRVFRGGSWNSDGTRCQAANRTGFAADGPGQRPRLPPCPSSRPVAGQGRRSERLRSPERRPAGGVGATDERRRRPLCRSGRGAPFPWVGFSGRRVARPEALRRACRTTARPSQSLRACRTDSTPFAKPQGVQDRQHALRKASGRAGQTARPSQSLRACRTDSTPFAKPQGVQDRQHALRKASGRAGTDSTPFAKPQGVQDRQHALRKASGRAGQTARPSQSLRACRTDSTPFAKPQGVQDRQHALRKASGRAGQTARPSQSLRACRTDSTPFAKPQGVQDSTPFAKPQGVQAQTARPSQSLRACHPRAGQTARPSQSLRACHPRKTPARRIHPSNSYTPCSVRSPRKPLAPGGAGAG